MKKIFSVMLLVCCLILASCGGVETAFPSTLDEFIGTFNSRAENTDYALGETAEADDGTTAVATKNEDSFVYCTESDDGALEKIEVIGSGFFQPGLGSYDYMVYAVIACDGSLDYTGAGDMIASMYYEAYTGGDSVVMSYSGMKFSFIKENYYCSLTIEPETTAE